MINKIQFERPSDGLVAGTESNTIFGVRIYLQGRMMIVLIIQYYPLRAIIENELGS